MSVDEVVQDFLWGAIAAKLTDTDLPSSRNRGDDHRLVGFVSAHTAASSIECTSPRLLRTPARWRHVARASVGLSAQEDREESNGSNVIFTCGR